MKKILLASITFLFSWNLLLASEFVDGDYGSEKINEDERGPFSFNITADAIGKADFKKWYIDNQHLEYSDINMNGSCIFYYEPYYSEGAQITVGYEFTRLLWRQNPFFDKTSFHTPSIAIEAFTKRAANWLWQGLARMNVDGDDWNLNLYANYDLLLWGRYTYLCDLGIHAGFLAQTGMKIDHIWPIIGFDWKYNDHWMINAVYPVNMSIVYSFNKVWSTSLAIRTFDHRQRVGKKEPLSRGLWRYRGSGIELGATYEESWVTANIHVGSTYFSELVISNRHNDHKRHFKLKNAPYFGGEVNLTF